MAHFEKQCSFHVESVQHFDCERSLAHGAVADCWGGDRGVYAQGAAITGRGNFLFACGGSVLRVGNDIDPANVSKRQSCAWRRMDVVTKYGVCESIYGGRVSGKYSAPPITETTATTIAAMV